MAESAENPAATERAVNDELELTDSEGGCTAAAAAAAGMRESVGSGIAVSRLKDACECSESGARMNPE